MRYRSGGCSCGSVRYRVTGEPLRAGICHCTSCRKESGSVFTAFAVWPESAFETSGETRQWERRHFCPKCGSRLFEIDGGEAEIKIGTLDTAPTDLSPRYELWAHRREPWLKPIERPAAAPDGK